MKRRSLTINAFLSSLKTLTTIIFPLITYPYITRVLSVENIGKINFGQSVVSYFSLLAGLGISTFAIRNGSQIREDGDKLNTFANQIFTINVASTILSCVLLLGLVYMPSKIAAYRGIILIQGIAVALSPLAVDWIYTIYEDFGYITLRSFLVHLLSLILMVTFVKQETDVYIYVALTSMSTSLGNIFNFCHSRKYVKLKLVSDTKWGQYKNSIFLFFINSIATVIYMNSDTTILGVLKDDRSVGLYSVAVKIYTILKQVFNAVIATTIPRLAYLRKNNNNEFESLIKRMISIATVCTIPVTAGIIILRKEIISLISGYSYIEATTTLAILAVAIFFAIMANILTNGVLICMGREKCVVKATMVSAIGNAALNFIFIPFFSQNGAAFTTLLAEMTVFGMALYYSRDLVIRLIDFSEFRNAIIGTVVMYVISIPLYMCVSKSSLLWRITMMIAGCVIVYAVVLLICRDTIIFEIIKQLKKKIRSK